MKSSSGEKGADVCPKVSLSKYRRISTVCARSESRQTVSVSGAFSSSSPLCAGVLSSSGSRLALSGFLAHGICISHGRRNDRSLQQAAKQYPARAECAPVEAEHEFPRDRHLGARFALSGGVFPAPSATPVRPLDACPPMEAWAGTPEPGMTARWG